MRRGKKDAREGGSALTGVAGIGARLLFLICKGGGLCLNTPKLDSGSRPALLDLDDGGGGPGGGPGSATAGCCSDSGWCDPLEYVLTALEIEESAVGVGPAEVDRRA